MTTSAITNITKVQKGSVKLPRQALKFWDNADVFLQMSGDTISLKRLTPPRLTFREMMDEFRAAARQGGITKRDVHEVLKKVRRERAEYAHSD